MKIYEVKDGNISRIEICEHKAVVKTFALMYNSENDKYNQICKFIEELDENRGGGFYGKKKELIKAFGEINERFKELYRELYPRGGYRNGGRPKGSKTDKTERLNLAVTPDEKVMLNDVLQSFRMHSEQNIEEMREALKPYLDKIDESLNGDKTAQQKFRARVNNMNPMLYAQLLEYFQVFGVEKAVESVQKQYLKKDNKKNDKRLKAIEEVLKERSRRKPRSLDEAYKEYQERQNKNL